MTTPADVLKLIKEKEVKFVDFRFTDTRGKEQHVSVPVKVMGMDKFEGGHAFDGSSIAGWKGINESDMILMPDAGTTPSQTSGCGCRTGGPGSTAPALLVLLVLRPRRRRE